MSTAATLSTLSTSKWISWSAKSSSEKSSSAASATRHRETGVVLDLSRRRVQILTKSGITVSVNDAVIPPKKKELLAEAEARSTPSPKNITAA
jgi:hypothetical protein